MKTFRLAILPAALLIALSGCSSDSGDTVDSTPAPTPEPAATVAPTAETESAASAQPLMPRTVYWGDTHVHTGWSADAGMDGAVKTPSDAYRFAMGETVESNTGRAATLKRPYDWFMITDHSDGMGVINEIIDGNPEMMSDETLARWRVALTAGGEAASAAKSELITLQSTGQLPSQVMDPKWMQSAWERTVDAAEQYNDPGKFTTFVAYEWTVNAGGGDNLHRNVIYRAGGEVAKQTLPLTTFETMDPHDLWRWMEAYEKKTGDRLLAIPHNGNLSNGRMFEEQQFDGSPMTAEWAQMRAKYEPLFEVTQIKGQSESHPSLSPNDDFAAWDLWDKGNLIRKPKPEGAYQSEYWREALKSGLRIETELGVNPFAYGANAGTDNHVGLSTSEEDNFFGKFKSVEPGPNRAEVSIIESQYGDVFGWEQAASGAMGVWAEENTREALWNAMARKETYASTGPRISVRFFGGFGYTPEDLEGDWVATGYSNGVPMGGSLSRHGENKAPTFIVAAMKDPEGANLDRIQVVKGWLDANGDTQEQIYDVQWSDNRVAGVDGKLPMIEDTVNRETGEVTASTGAAQFTAVFTDPDFDPDLSAVYYVRVLEIPTARWTLHDKIQFDAVMSDDVPLVHQERAFSSPIWYKP